jgi:hypothetical protein
MPESLSCRHIFIVETALSIKNARNELLAYLGGDVNRKNGQN